jgi:RNA polymerase sigma-70 factor (ECF subfamily)
MNESAKTPDPCTGRLRQLVDEHLDFVWRSLRRLGVREADCDDGCQRVWLVVSKKHSDIAPGKERSFIFSVAVRIASEMRRRDARHNQWDALDTTMGEPNGDRDSSPERSLEQKRAVVLLDALLDILSDEQRTVFVMFELEGFSSVEIAHELGLSRGTVASRLRLARDAFERALASYEMELGQRSRASGE